MLAGPRPSRTTTAELSPPRLPTRLARYARRAAWRCIWRRRLAAVGPQTDIHWPAYVVGGRGIVLGAQVAIWHHARLEAFNTRPGGTRISIGDLTTIQPYVHIGAADCVRIGRGVLMASFVYISDHDHDWSDPDDPVILNARVRAAPVEIGDFVWLGERVIVLKGVTIGPHSIIGAGSVVTRDVPPHAVAAGAPARVIRCYDHKRRIWVPVS
jgi:lipopolysaccharide O-acetyltransferase